MAEEVSAEPSDGMHIMFGMVIVPYVMELMASCNDFKLKLCFRFFEQMANEEDAMISEVLEFTVLENLISNGRETLNKCKAYMGKKTLECCSMVEKYMT